MSCTWKMAFTVYDRLHVFTHSQTPFSFPTGTSWITYAAYIIRSYKYSRCRYNVVHFITILHYGTAMKGTERKSDFTPHPPTLPYLAFTGKQSGVCVRNWGKIDRVITAPYYDIKRQSWMKILGHRYTWHKLESKYRTEISLDGAT